MTTYLCTGCSRPFCIGCDRAVDAAAEATPAPRYCEGCIELEATANGLPVETIRAARSRRRAQPCEHTRTWALKVRPNPGSPISTNFECEEHGYFTATVPRANDGGPPENWSCPSCEQPSAWRPTAPLGRVKLGEVVRGKVEEYPPGHVGLDTRPLADGMPVHEWRAKQEAITRDMNFRKWRERDGGPRKVHFT